MSRLTVFWIAHITSMVVFVAGVCLQASIWLQGQVDGRAPGGWRAAIASSWRFLRRAGFRRTLRALGLDGLYHRRLASEDRLRWGAHACVLGSFVALTVLSTVTGVGEEVLIGLFKVHHPLVEALVAKDTPFMALANETLGLVMILGLAYMAFRRYVQRPSQLRTDRADNALMLILAITLLSGYPTEALRLLKDGVAAPLAWYSYIGYPLSLPFRGLNWPWERLHYWTFIFHSLFASAFFAYVPFSKFFHVLVSPVVATVNSLTREVQGA